MDKDKEPRLGNPPESCLNGRCKKTAVEIVRCNVICGVREQFLQDLDCWGKQGIFLSREGNTETTDTELWNRRRTAGSRFALPGRMPNFQIKHKTLVPNRLRGQE